MSQGKSAEKVVQEIRRKTRRQFSAEEKIRIVLDDLTPWVVHFLRESKAHGQSFDERRSPTGQLCKIS
ncbi:MAG: hypothetical protein QF463_09775 [Vicinamibacterales bacterium]|jgi:hypothetical protein|nr:hypothetical protein [Vicinamibacterales bacterium]